MVVPGHFAAIDLGSNTFHLVIFKDTGNGANVLIKNRIPVGIGKGGIEKNTITDEALERGIKALLIFRATVEQYNCKKVVVTATSAFRSADNRTDVLCKIKEQTGFGVKIIDGDEEASLIYDGVKQAVNLGEKTGLIMDIGGGSVEFIICNKSRILWKESFEIGGIRLMERFHKTDPLPEKSMVALKDHLISCLHNLFVACLDYHPQYLIGASGSFDTLYEIREANFDSLRELTLSLQEFNQIKNLVVAKNYAERLEIKGLIKMRAEMISVACVLIETVIHKCNLEWIECSSHSLKEGLMYRMINEKTVF